MDTILIIVLLLLLLGGGGGYYGYKRYGGPGLGGALGVVLVVLLVHWPSWIRISFSGSHPLRLQSLLPFDALSTLHWGL